MCFMKAHSGYCDGTIEQGKEMSSIQELIVVGKSLGILDYRLLMDFVNTQQNLQWKDRLAQCQADKEHQEAEECCSAYK